MLKGLSYIQNLVNHLRIHLDNNSVRIINAIINICQINKMQYCSSKFYSLQFDYICLKKNPKLYPELRFPQTTK